MTAQIRVLPDWPLTLVKARAFDTHDKIDCPSLWTSTTDDDDAVVALFVELAYDAMWTRGTLTADIADLGPDSDGYDVVASANVTRGWR